MPTLVFVVDVTNDLTTNKIGAIKKEGIFRAIFYSTLEVRKKYKDILYKYKSLFIDNSKFADVPKDKQITIPLVSNQRTTRAKLA